MPYRRTFTALALAFALAGMMLPADHIGAQIGQPAAQPSDTNRNPPDIGWLGLLGLVGLFGLFGTKSGDQTISVPRRG